MSRFRRRRPRGDDGFAFEATVGSGGTHYTNTPYRRMRNRDGVIFGAGGVIITIDTSEIYKLQDALQNAGRGVARGDRIMVAALNNGMDGLNTRLKRKLREWTGIKRAKYVNDRLRKHPASAGRWEAAVRVESPYTRIDDLFSARFLPRFKAVGHSAWNVRRRAGGAFMLPGSSHAIKRVGAGRWDLKPLFGPNLAREMDRHTPMVRALTVYSTQRFVLPEMERLVSVELQKAKNISGL